MVAMVTRLGLNSFLAAHYSHTMTSSSKDGFMRPMEYRPEVALIKTPQQALLDQLGLAGETHSYWGLGGHAGTLLGQLALASEYL